MDPVYRVGGVHQRPEFFFVTSSENSCLEVRNTISKSLETFTQIEFKT